MTHPKKSIGNHTQWRTLVSMPVKLLTVIEAADVLRVSDYKLREMIHAREIPFLKVGGQYRVPETALDRWVKANTVQPTSLAEEFA